VANYVRRFDAVLVYWDIRGEYDRWRLTFWGATWEYNYRPDMRHRSTIYSFIPGLSGWRDRSYTPPTVGLTHLIELVVKQEGSVDRLVTRLLREYPQLCQYVLTRSSSAPCTSGHSRPSGSDGARSG
jgi:hypothetical protein